MTDPTSAVAYYRTSSLTNVGEDKDSERRQQDAVAAYARRHGIEIVGEFYDAGVKGSEWVHQRPGFAAMLQRLDESGASMILVENASRFARDVMVQEFGVAYLKQRGISLIAVDDPDAFTSDTPTGKLVRQMLGAVAEFERAGMVAKLRHARDRKRETTGRCEGRKPAPDAARAIARAMRAEGATLRAIAEELRFKGYQSPGGRTYGPESVRSMLRGSSGDVA
jgi:DNA invertase Pin-like site-specific DNA recombinase